MAATPDNFDWSDWYFQIGDHTPTTEAYSTATQAYVSKTSQAYLQVLKIDGCGLLWRTWRRIDLYLDGFARKLWRYWRIPAFDVTEHTSKPLAE